MLLAAAQVSVAQSPNTSVASVCSSCVISVCSLLLYGECSLNCREDDATSGDHICRLQQTELFSMVVDNDGITLFVDPNGINMFKAANLQDKIRTAPQHWRAIQECLANFAEHAVIVSHDRWRVIKLCGKTYDFDETGIVAAMSGLNAVDTQVLNISSFGSNVTLVLDEALDASVASLCESLKLTRVEYRGVGRGETGDVVPC
ncbi:hypothetical protein DYB30_003122 [Aphanomyces astaci]|uniref:CASTOR ACT domain-containing protein n=2 Tax=Aphanomyces astaci TaxID=112090 RepID=A0A397D492_APHAT|nr:hypothetical protein DYB30_003122 [Aphanomyces astaci]